jgi:hypothetical protein
MNGCILLRILVLPITSTSKFLLVDTVVFLYYYQLLVYLAKYYQ